MKMGNVNVYSTTMRGVEMSARDAKRKQMGQNVERLFFEKKIKRYIYHIVNFNINYGISS